MKDREVKYKIEIEELFFKPIMVSIDDMGWFEKKRNEENKTNSKHFNTLCDWLTNNIPEPIRKSVGGFKDNIVRFLKTNTNKQTV